MNAFWQNLCFLLNFSIILDHMTHNGVREIVDFSFFERMSWKPKFWNYCLHIMV